MIKRILCLWSGFIALASCDYIKKPELQERDTGLRGVWSKRYKP